MRSSLSVLAVSAPLVFAAAAVAAPVPVAVDFSGATPPIDLTTSSPTIDGVTISYVGLDATVDQTGINGSVSGLLGLDFGQDIGHIQFNWIVMNVVSDAGGGPTGPGVTIYAGANDPINVAGTYDPGTDSLSGVAVVDAFQGFSSASIFFNQGNGGSVTPDFSISSLQYQVPEPSVIGIGLAACGGLLVRKRQPRTRPQRQ